VADRATLWLASGAAAICAVTGLAWAAAPAPTPIRIFLATLAMLGASALVAAGLWQSAAAPRTRVLLVVLLAGLAGGYVAAGTLGLVITGGVIGVGILRAFLWLGVVVGAALYVVAVMRALGAIREERGAAAPPASPGTTAG
jgi:hypothetical protein